MSQIYQDGTYLEKNPTWHTEDSQWKARHIKQMIEKNKLTPKTICEVGCGAGEVLNNLSEEFSGGGVEYFGYEISPQAFNLCKDKSKSFLNFYLKDLLTESDKNFDLVMAIDVFEHVEDYMGFLKKLRKKGTYKIFHIPLDLSVQTVLRTHPIIRLRKSVGHIHYFMKETALETLKDTGYEIIDYCYTGSTVDFSTRGWKANLLRIPRKILFWINKDLPARILGGYSLLVLTK